VVAAYRGVLERIAEERLTTNVALKLTHLGLDLGELVARGNVAAVVSRAGELGNFVRIDMEESARVEATLRIYRQVRADGHGNVGTVLQSALHRTEEDLRRLLPLRPNLRLVKGAYLEPPSVAHARKADVDAAYLRLAERMVGEIPFTAIATHDERIIERVAGWMAKRGLGPEQVEFQLLYGIRPALQESLVRQGHRVLVATPFGPQWYPYLMRRLAERPANLLFFGRNLVRR
jgi:proline dehydrogenase